MAEQLDLPLSVPLACGTVLINGRCTLRTEGEHRVLFVAGLPVHHYSVGDAVAEAYATVMLVDTGYNGFVPVQPVMDPETQTRRGPGSDESEQTVVPSPPSDRGSLRLGIRGANRSNQTLRWTAYVHCRFVSRGRPRGC